MTAVTTIDAFTARKIAPPSEAVQGPANQDED